MTLTVQPDPLDELAAAARAALGCDGTPDLRAFRAAATPERVLALVGAIADLRRLIALETHPDGHSWEEIRLLAETLHGLAYGCAFEAEDMDLLFEMTGRRWRLLDPGEHGTSPNVGGREAGPRG